MNRKVFYILMLVVSLVSCSKTQKQAAESQEIMEVTGIITSYDEDVMYIKVLRSGMNLPLRCSDATTFDICPAPKDTVLLVYTGDLGDLEHLPLVREIYTRPFRDSASKVVNLNELKSSGELIVKP